MVINKELAEAGLTHVEFGTESLCSVNWVFAKAFVLPPNHAVAPAGLEADFLSPLFLLEAGETPVLCVKL